MFKATLSDPNILKTSFDAISSIVDEALLLIDEGGIRLDAIDRAHITFVHLELKPELFEEFTCDKPLKIGADTEEFIKVLKRAKSEDILELSVDEGNLIITFEGEARRVFKIRLIDIKDETPTPPKLDYPAEIEIPIDLLKTFIQDIAIFSDKVALSTEEDRFIASGVGEFGGANIEYPLEETYAKTRSVFSLEKIREMLKADKFSDFATLSIGNDMPLVLSFKIGEEGELSFLLAPRIESEE